MSKSIIPFQQVLRVLYNTSKNELNVKSIVPVGITWDKRKADSKPEWLLKCMDINHQNTTAIPLTGIREVTEVKDELSQFLL